MVFGGIMALVAGADQAVKAWVEAQEQKDFPRSMENSGGKVMLYRNHNSGFPFGFLKEEKEVVKLLPLVVTSMLGGIFLYLGQKREKPLTRFALALTVGGGLSNLYDRFARKYVVDYFSLQFGPLKKVVLNLGDLCVLLGTGILAVQEICNEGRGNNSRPVCTCCKSDANTAEEP